MNSSSSSQTVSESKYNCKWGKPREGIFQQKQKVFKINLDLPPKQRWFHLIDSNRKAIMSLIEEASNDIPLWAVKLTPTCSIKKYSLELFYEFEAIAEILNIDIAIVFWMNMMYEIYTKCTSLITQDSKGNILHGRNLDWENPGKIAEIYCVCEFYTKGELLYKGNVVPGCLGILSGEKPGCFSLSINQNEQEDIDKDSFCEIIKAAWQNIIYLLWDKKLGCQLVARKAFEKASCYEEAVRIVSEGEIAAPCYYIISGVNSNEGIIINRGREGVLESETLDTNKGKWYLVQTNYNRKTQDPENDNRRSFVEQCLEQIGKENISENRIMKILSTYPALNAETIMSGVFSSQKNKFTSQGWIDQQ